MDVFERLVYIARNDEIGWSLSSVLESVFCLGEKACLNIHR